MQDDKKLKREKLKRAMLTLVFTLILIIIGFYFYDLKNMNPDLYKVSLGPFLEEAIKGGFAFAIFIPISVFRFKEKIVQKKYLMITGAGIGFIIGGFYEFFIVYTPGIHRVIPAINHIFWTATVAGGIWLFMTASKHKDLKLMIPYLSASVLHVLWNYHAFIEEKMGSEFTLGAISFILTVFAFFLVWKFG